MTTRRRALSLRGTLMLIFGATFGFVAIIGLVLAVRVVPRASDLTTRSSETRDDFLNRTRFAAQLDSVALDFSALLRAAPKQALPYDALRTRREHLEQLMKRSLLLSPVMRPTRTSREVTILLERADGAALQMTAYLLGAVGMMEVNDLASAQELMQDADRSRTPLQLAMSEVTTTALAELTREEARHATEARSAATFVLAWVAFGALLLPLFWWLMKTRLFAPLASLDRSLSRIERGELDVEVPITHDDEIGRLEQHFNRTTRVLREQQEASARAAERAGQEASEARYRAAFEQAEVGLAEIDLDGRYARVNPALCRILGRSYVDIIGHKYAEFTHPDDAATDRENWPRLTEQGESVVRIEKRYIRGNGTAAFVQVTATLLRDNDGSPRHVLSVVHDVTEHRRLEHELLQSKKLDAVGQLAGGVAHDFNNLLMAIIGYADLLDHDAANSPEIREDATAIRQTALRGADLARSLLTLARRNPPRREPFSVQEMVRETADLVQRTFDRRIELHVHCDVKATVNGDRSLVSNALLNLSLNARDAMPDGGLLRLEARLEAPDPAFRALHGLEIEGAYTVLSVIDTGTGMTRDVREHLFEPFFTTKAAGKGTGLGLAMVYATVRDHGGAILVESEPERGATFSIYLPCAAGEGVAVPPTRAPLSASAPARVLIVDDEELVRDVAVRMLERLGYSVEVAGDGLAGLERLSGDDHGVDLVILDGNMPRLNGLETARRIHARHPQLPLIYATGYLQPDTDQDLMALGFRERLNKPYTIDKLSRAVARALGRSTAEAR